MWAVLQTPVGAEVGWAARCTRGGLHMPGRLLENQLGKMAQEGTKGGVLFSVREFAST